MISVQNTHLVGEWAMMRCSGTAEIIEAACKLIVEDPKVLE